MVILLNFSVFFHYVCLHLRMEIFRVWVYILLQYFGRIERSDFPEEICTMFSFICNHPQNTRHLFEFGSTSLLCMIMDKIFENVYLLEELCNSSSTVQILYRLTFLCSSFYHFLNIMWHWQMLKRQARALSLTAIYNSSVIVYYYPYSPTFNISLLLEEVLLPYWEIRLCTWYMLLFVIYIKVGTYYYSPYLKGKIRKTVKSNFTFWNYLGIKQ